MRSDFPHLSLLTTESGIQGLNQLYRSPPTLILIDSTLSDISGLQVCRVIKRDPVICKLPVMIITKEASREYERFSELSLIADAFLEEKKLGQEFVKLVNSLLSMFEGIDESEKEQLKLLQQDSVQVQAMTRMVQLFDQSITEAALMKGFNKLFELISNKNILYHMLFSLIENVLDYDVAAVFFNDRNRDPRLMMYHIPRNYIIKDEQLKAWTEQLFQDLKEKASEPWIFNSIRYETIKPDFLDAPGKAVTIKHQVVFPFYVESTLVGLLALFSEKNVNYEIIFPFSLLLREMSALMRIRYYYTEAEMLTICDSLTGLYTHQHFMWALEREIRQSKRHNTPVTLALISVDDFRELNLKWGFNMGDRVMQHLAHHSLQSVRNVDLLARAGGRKILALFPNTSPKAALNALERIQGRILNSPLKWEDEIIPINLSIGAVGLDENINSASEYIEQVQKAVDQARRKGHNHLELIQ